MSRETSEFLRILKDIGAVTIPERVIAGPRPLEPIPARSRPYNEDVIGLAIGSEADQTVLSKIFSESKWRLWTAKNTTEALSAIQERGAGVVIADVHLPDGSPWYDFILAVRSINVRPVPRVIIASETADDQLWSEALNLGAYNVLAKPFDRKEVFWVVSHAWLDWERDRAGSGQGVFARRPA